MQEQPTIAVQLPISSSQIPNDGAGNCQHNPNQKWVGTKLLALIFLYLRESLSASSLLVQIWRKSKPATCLFFKVGLYMWTFFKLPSQTPVGCSAVPSPAIPIPAMVPDFS